MESIIQADEGRCYLCWQPPNFEDGNLEEHHIFGGNPNRKHSEKYGLTVKLHAFKCHRLGSGSVHMNKKVRIALQTKAQEKFEEVHGSREEFMKIFGKNLL